MNTLFNTTFETEEASHYEHTVRLRPRTYDLQESNVHLKLTIVDAVGFGDQINKDERQVTFQFDPETFALFWWGKDVYIPSGILDFIYCACDGLLIISAMESLDDTAVRKKRKQKQEISDVGQIKYNPLPPCG